MQTCSAITKKGKPCRNGAMAGSPFCGPHTDQATAAPVVVTKVEPISELNPTQRFSVWVREQMPNHAFCCEYHKDVMQSIVDAMNTRGISDAQLKYARDIVTGRARHNSGDPTKIFTIKCYRFKCQNEITGTRYELAAMNNACEEHRS